MEPIEITLDYRQKSPLMEWLGSFDILKYVTERDISDMFCDGVLFFNVLREIFEEEIRDADLLATRILPSENYMEKLENWRILNEAVMEKLKIGRSSWFIEYLARGNTEYIENLLNALREIAPPVRSRQNYYKSDIYEMPSSSNYSRRLHNLREDAETDYFDDKPFHSKFMNRSYARRQRQRALSPFPRMKLARERVIWGVPTTFKASRRHYRPAGKHSERPLDSHLRYFFERSKFGPKQKSYNYGDSYGFCRGGEARRTLPVQTYCFLDGRKPFKRQLRKATRGKQSFERKAEFSRRKDVDINVRFNQLMQTYSPQPRFRKSKYIYRYYEQYQHGECNYCNPLDDNEDVDLNELL